MKALHEVKVVDLSVRVLQVVQWRTCVGVWLRVVINDHQPPFYDYVSDAAVQTVRSQQETQDPARSRVGSAEEGNRRHSGLSDGIADAAASASGGAGGTTIGGSLICRYLVRQSFADVVAVHTSLPSASWSHFSGWFREYMWNIALHSFYYYY